MFPFKKKTEDEEEKVDLPVKKRKSRKKVEPSKPWGKIERFIIFIFLVGLPLISLTFLAKSKNATSLSSLQTKVLGESISNPDDLKTKLTSEVKNLQGTYGIWVQPLDGSFAVGINDNEIFDGASIFKVPLMISYFKAVDSGSINPETNYTIKYSDALAGAGILANMPAGTNVTYKDIVQTLGKDSDNTAFQIMSSILGSNAESGIINEIGMQNTDFQSSTTTPRDIGLIFFKLANTNLISSNSKDELFKSLTNTDFESLIPASIPQNLKIVHKYGADDGELNDAGIVYSSKPYVLVILSKDINQNEAVVEIPKISKIVYDWIAK